MTSTPRDSNLGVLVGLIPSGVSNQKILVGDSYEYTPRYRGLPIGFLLTMIMNFNSIDDRHAQEFADSAIAQEISALNFHSFDGENENELDEAFTLLIEEPDHNNNGTLAGKSPNDLANTLRSGGWIFEGYKGGCVKPNLPRKVKDENGKEKNIKYESPRGAGNMQLFIPRISWEIGRKLVAKVGSVSEVRYLERMDENANPSDEDCGFWNWVLETNIPIIITEGAKKACSLVSNGYTAIALNGVWGWGTNDQNSPPRFRWSVMLTRSSTPSPAFVMGLSAAPTVRSCSAHGCCLASTWRLARFAICC